MMGNTKGNVVIASMILAAALCVCTLVMAYSLKKFQNNAFAFVDKEKMDVISRFRDQKNEFKRFEWGREARLRDLIKDELRKSTIEIKKANQ